MKNVKKIYKSVLIILVIISCTDSRDLGFLEEVVLPSNISALFDITQDNSGLDYDELMPYLTKEIKASLHQQENAVLNLKIVTSDRSNYEPHL